MRLPVIYIFTHDSIGLGEDGPTHQPIEQLIGLRAVPGLIALRPADANEVIEAWRVIVGLKDAPACLVLSRQALPTFDRSRYASAAGVARGGYVLADAPRRPARCDPDRHRQRSGACVCRRRDCWPRRASRRAWSVCRHGSCSTGRMRLIGKACCRKRSGRGSRSRPARPRGWERYAGADGAMIGMHRFRRFGAQQGFDEGVSASPPSTSSRRAKAQIAKWKTVMNPLRALAEKGQAVWLDFLSRDIIAEWRA